MPYEKSTSSSPEAQSASPIQDNLKALAALFPSVVRDGQVDVDALRQLCGEAVVKEDELFGLNWRGKAEARRAALTPSLGTLRPCKEESKNWDTTQNLYIEGDNLEVLKLLRKSYGGKVKMIYIDPPYNTGKEFVYPDNYQNGIENYKKLTGQEGRYAANVETSGRYHTTWLNMMYPRLVLARELLSEDGVIYISIDDNEVSNLQKISDEVFGFSNKIGLMTLMSNPRGSQNGKHLSHVHEYLLMYCKNSSVLEIRGISKDEESLSEFKETDNDGRRYRLLGLRKRGGAWKKEDRPNMFYPVYVNPENGKCSLNRTAEFTIEVIPQKPTGELSRWTWGQDKFLNESSLLVGRKINRIGETDAWDIYRKDYIDDETGIEKTTKVRTIWDEKETNYQNAKNEIKALFGNSEMFDYPKPTYIVKKLATMLFCEENDIILDFFSGSSSAAHAVMQLNAEDGGNRRFIMVQLPEPTEEGGEAYKAGYKNICEIGKERIRRAGDKVKEEAGLAGQNLDIGFRVYKLDSSNVKAWNPQAEDLATAVNNYAEHLVGGRTEDDFLTEIMLKSGIDLVEDVQEREIAGHRVQSLGYGQYYACMAADLADDAEDVALGIAAWHEEDCAFAGGEQQDTCTVFVSDRAFDSNDAAKMNFVAILEQHGICNIKAL